VVRDRETANRVVGFQRRYLSALRSRASSGAGPGRGGRLGTMARETGIRVTALARIHHLALGALAPPAGGARGRRRRDLRAAAFLAEVLASFGEPDRHPNGARAECRRLGRSLDRETGRRRTAQAALGAAACEHRVLLERSRAMEEQLRHFSRRLLRSHEEERRLISRELHDALGQTLAGISVGLSRVSGEAARTPRGLRAEVERTRRLVELSMKTVHRFARDLRPSLLDDLGLAPALQALAKEFAMKSGARVRLSCPEEPGGLDNDRRTALFRVAQEALINVVRHARARNVEVALRMRPGVVRLEIWNDGRTFDAARMMEPRRNRRLGILCMQERVEMVGGTFVLRSAPGRGTTVRADVPLEAPARA